MFMFTALEEWHHIPWLGIHPITKEPEEYPEVKYSMFRLLEFKHLRMRRDEREADAQRRLHSSKR